MAARGEAGDTGATVSAESTEMDRCRLVQLLAHIKELQGGAARIDSDAVRGIVSEVPDWMMGADEKRNLGEIALHQSKKKLKEMTAYMRNMAEAKLSFLEAESRMAAEWSGQASPPPPPPPTSKKPDTKAIIGKPSSKTSKTTVGSSVVESRREVVVEERRTTTTTQHQGKTQELTRDSADHRGSSMMTVRTPSPTFITIESVRRTDSPRHGVTPSPPPYRAVGTPPPPPRRPYPAQSPLLSRATPSPTLSRSEKVVQLKTPRGGTTPTPPPPPPHHPQPLVEELLAGREGSPGYSFVASYTVSEEEGPGPEAELEGCAEDGDSMMTVRDKKSFFEEAQRAEVTKVYTRKDPIEIPERLTADAEEPRPATASPDPAAAAAAKEGLPLRVDLSKLVNRFESPQPPPALPRKEPIVIAERLGSDTEEDGEAQPRTPRAEDVPAFNVRALKDVFETGEHGSQAARDLREHIERRESESEPHGHSETTTTTSSAATTVVSELFAGLDDFGDAAAAAPRGGGSRCSETHTSVQCSSTSSVAVAAAAASGRGSPPSYADVVRGATEVLSEAAEEMLRNYQQSWAESQEAVLQGAGVTVTEQRSSQSVTRHHHHHQQQQQHHHQTVATGKLGRHGMRRP